MPVQTLHDNVQMHITQSLEPHTPGPLHTILPTKTGRNYGSGTGYKLACEGPSRPQNIPSMKCPPMRLHDFRQGQKRQRQKSVALSIINNSTTASP